MSQPTVVPVAPIVPVGATTKFGSLFALVAAVGAIYAGVEGNDVATVTGGLVSALAVFKVLGGRYAQATALIVKAAPVVEQVARDVQVAPTPEA